MFIACDGSARKMQELPDMKHLSKTDIFRTLRRSERLKSVRKLCYKEQDLRRRISSPVVPDDKLTLYLNPRPKKVEFRTPLSEIPSVSLTDFNILPATIKGKKCELYVDSGTSRLTMIHKEAEKLGLLDHVVRHEMRMIVFWTEKVKARLKIVSGVPFKLDDDREILSEIFIFPPGLREYCPAIFLDNRTLRKYNVI